MSQSSICLWVISCLLFFPLPVRGQSPGNASEANVASQSTDLPIPPASSDLIPFPELSGVSFVKDSSSQIILERDGKRFLIDTATQKIFVIASKDSKSPSTNQAEKAPNTPAGEPASPTSPPAKKSASDRDGYYTEDIILWTLPTAHHIEKHSLYVDFSHRFSYDTTFVGPARLSYLFGMDGFSVSSFGLTYGLTNRFFVGAYRVPTALGRELQFGIGAQLTQEQLGQPFSSIVRVSVEGTNDFRDEYITSLEFALAKTIKKRAQLYLVPTISFNNRSLQDVIDLQGKGKGDTTVALGAGISIDIRPTVAFVAEANPRLTGLLGVQRASFMLGVQKKIFRHSFTFGFTNSPGTSISQRSATRSALFPGYSDSWSGLGIGFNISRRLF
ncbi:MAG: DUF5777 family beta-barrel protein [Terriglobia bacterium]